MKAAGNVVDIRGVVKTDKGQLTNVTGRLLKDGEVVQEYAYVPYSPEFSLAGTLNASMHFADLSGGSNNISADRRGGKQGRYC